MSIVNVIDRVRAWSEKSICDKVLLKAAPAEGEAADGGYKYKLVHPAAFPMYVPTKDRLPPPVLSPIPSLCVRVLDGADSLVDSSGAVNIQLGLSAWNPGTHAKDLYDCSVVGDGLIAFKQHTTPDGDSYFVQDAAGWRDAWNFLDVARREIEAAKTIDGLQIDQRVGVKFGPYQEQDSIPDFYPLWFAWLTFGVRYPIVTPKYSEFL